ncbi:hypothetical protein BDR05DRAFT_633802 [Suillus weaverae]|nr:hypothetical protein BDR05DRAFT_633802 [Suillus weaverae]
MRSIGMHICAFLAHGYVRRVRRLRRHRLDHGWPSLWSSWEYQIEDFDVGISSIIRQRSCRSVAGQSLSMFVVSGVRHTPLLYNRPGRWPISLAISLVLSNMLGSSPPNIGLGYVCTGYISALVLFREWWPYTLDCWQPAIRYALNKSHHVTFDSESDINILLLR